MALIDKASLLMVPSVYEDGTLYNVLPSGNKAPDETGNHNGYDQTRADFTFSRGFNLTATRVNANGLIEKGRENLVTYSNDFSNAAWAHASSSTTIGFEGYDGTNNAWKWSSVSTGTAQLTQSHGTSGMITHSIYAKAGTIDVLKIWVGLTAEFNLTTGVASYSQSKMTDVGNGWWRCEVYLPYTIFNPYFTATTAGDYIYIMNAQAEAGLVATEYIETEATTATAGVLENTPRIDYSSGAGALLLESQRTNKITNSEYINTTTFNYSSLVTINNNHATSPDGFKNAAKITADASSGYHQLRTSLATANGYDIVSCFVKASGYNYVQLASWANPANYVNFDLTDGSIGSVGSTPPTNYDIEDYGNGWYRIHANVQASGGGIIGIGIVTSASAGWAESFTGNGTDGLLIWGVQIEAGSHVSSYVPTYGSAATRGADSLGSLNITNLITGTPFTWFLDLNEWQGSSTNVGDLFLSNPSGAQIQLRVRTDGYRFFYNSINGGTLYPIAASKTARKFCIKYDGSNFKLFRDGVLENTTASVGDTGWSGISQAAGGSTLPLKEIIVFNEALTDAECQTLTA